MTKVTSELETKQREFTELKEIRDVLLNGQGKLLEQVSCQVFNEMGIAFVEGPEAKDDLILKVGNETTLVCEVKGTNSSAAGAHATQLNKWCDRVFDEEKHFPKGSLVINAFREADLIERNEAVYPSEMLEYSRKKEFCLMTTVQLFNM